jgi:hypothetical protein
MALVRTTLSLLLRKTCLTYQVCGLAKALFPLSTTIVL